MTLILCVVLISLFASFLCSLCVLEYLLGSPIVGEHDTHPLMQRLARERARFHEAPPLQD